MGIFSIIWMIIIGFIVGVLARFFYPGAVSMGFWMTALLGIGGSLVGGVIGGLLFATCATLFLVPTMFSVVHARDRKTAETAGVHAGTQA